MPARPPIKHQQASPLFAQEPFHFGDRDTCFSPNLHGCYFAFFDPTPHGQRMKAQAFCHFS
jgi:hypothetical protein